MGNPEAGLKAPKAPPVPEIYKLISAEAGAEAIVQQLYVDLHAGSLVTERLFLGFQELLNRGFEGEGALRFIAKGSDELSAIAKKILAMPKVSSEQLEKVLGIQRWGPSGDITDMKSFGDVTLQAHTYATAKGYTNLPYWEAVQQMEASMAVRYTTYNDLKNRTEGSIFANAATFGTAEPTYLELLGPKEVLRLRTLPEANFLLLGSLGPQSAREFAKFTKKIQPGIRPLVIDRDEKDVSVISGDPDVDKKDLLVADATSLPFADNSIEHIYTNYLLHFLHDDHGNDEKFKPDIQKIFKEAKRVLKPGGSIVLSEQSYGMYKRSESKSLMVQEIKSLALQAGFKLASELSDVLSFLLVRETNGARIDELGFAHYEDTFISRQPGSEAHMRFVKK